MRFRLLPREEKFFDLFDEFAALLMRTAEKFLDMVLHFDRLRERSADLRKEERDGDQIIERIIQALDRTFITPFDREDIHALATSLDDVLDNMEETSHRLESFRISRPTEPAIAMARIVRDCTIRLAQAVQLCRDMGKAHEIQDHLREISRLENEADRLYRDTDGALFANPPELLELIKWRELYGWLEETVDACKDVAMIISEIVIKGSYSMHFFDSAARDFGRFPWEQLSLTVCLLIALALLFDFLNGFHDAANSVATIVSTRVLTPGKAIIWASFFNFIAFLVFHLKVADTMGKEIIDPAIVNNRVIASTLIAACAWDIITWYWALPTSSSHALIGGLVGSALVNTGFSALKWWGIGKTVLFIVLAPLIGMVLGLSIAVAVAWIFRRATPRKVDSFFRKGQLVSASLYSLGHGGNDAQKTMGIIFVLLLSATAANPDIEWRDRFVLTNQWLNDAMAKTEKQKDRPASPERIPTDVLTTLKAIEDKTFTRQASFEAELPKVLSEGEIKEYREVILKAADHAQVPTEVVLACHIAMGFGTLFGGWRIVKTMGQKIIKLRPVDGFCAEGGAAATLVLTIVGGVPVSTTHTITGSIVGVGATKRLSAVRWGIAERVVWAWVLTIPAAALIAGLSWLVLGLFS